MSDDHVIRRCLAQPGGRGDDPAEQACHQRLGGIGSVAEQDGRRITHLSRKAAGGPARIGGRAALRRPADLYLTAGRGVEDGRNVGSAADRQHLWPTVVGHSDHGVGRAQVDSHLISHNAPEHRPRC